MNILYIQVNGFPYIRLDSTIHHFVKAADDYLSDNEGWYLIISDIFVTVFQFFVLIMIAYTTIYKD